MVVTHLPFKCPPPRLFMKAMEVNESDNVGEFKKRWAEMTGRSPDLATVIVDASVREDAGVLKETEFIPSKRDGNIFIHVRVEDPEVLAQVRA